MNLFSRPTVLSLTDESYMRWLRARSPQPIGFFLDLEEVEQEALALLGDAYTQDVCLGIGFAVNDPIGAQAGLEEPAGPGDSQDPLLRLAQQAARKARSTPESVLTTPATRGAPTMGGLSERSVARVAATQKKADESRSFLGKAPDQSRTDSGPIPDQEAAE